MRRRIGDPLPREYFLSIYFWVATGAGVVTTVSAWRGMHGWTLPLVLVGAAVVLALLPLVGARQHEFVEIDETGVAVATSNGIERVSWADLTKVTILTTDAGPWAEDVFFVLETREGPGCVVPHDAAVRTALLEELQNRLVGLRNEEVVQAMGSTSNNRFTIWEATSANAA